MSVASRATRGGNQSIETGFELPALGATLWRKRWGILLPVLLVGLATFIVVELITPRYQSESRVIVEARDNIYLRPDADKVTTDRTVDEQAVTSQAQLILSRELANEVIDKLKLGQSPEFDVTLGPPSPVRTVLAALGIIRDPMKMTAQERVLEAYYDRLTVYPVEKSRVIVIDFLSENPELAARVANAIADGYLELQRKAKQEQAQTARQALAGEIDSMRKRVVEAEAKVEDYRAKSNLLLGANNTTLSAQQLADVNAQLAAARAQKADAEAKAKLIRDMLRSGEAIESSDILNSELIRRLSEQRVTLRAQLAEQSSSLLDNHPRIKELKAQIADLDKQIKDEAAKIARSLENDAKVAAARLDTLTASLNQLKSQAAVTNQDDVQLRELERDAKSQRDLLESYLAKYREATARDNITSSPADARVISRATVSNVPAYPKKVPAVLIAMLATLVLAAGFALTKELLAVPAVGLPSAVPPTEDAEEPAGSRAAVALKASRQEISPTASASAIAFSRIEDVAAAVSEAPGEGGVIAVFGGAGAGDPSWTALKLARLLGAGARVVLVAVSPADAAIRAASNDPAASGLADLVQAEASFGDIITRDRQTNLHLISFGGAPIERAQLLSTSAATEAFAALSRSYDCVVIAAGAAAGSDLEAVAGLAEYAVLASASLGRAAIAAAYDSLIAAGFADVSVIADGRAADFAETAAAA